MKFTKKQATLTSQYILIPVHLVVPNAIDFVNEFILLIFQQIKD